jgi:hypothetical protein
LIDVFIIQVCFCLNRRNRRRYLWVFCLQFGFICWMTLSLTLPYFPGLMSRRNRRSRGDLWVFCFTFSYYFSNTSLSHYLTKRLLTTYVVKNVEQYCAMGVGWDYLQVAPGVKMTKWREVWARWRRWWLNVHTTNLMIFIGWSMRATSQGTEWTSNVCDAVGTWLKRCIVQFDRLEWGVGGSTGWGCAGWYSRRYGIGIPGIGTRGLMWEWHQGGIFHLQYWFPCEATPQIQIPCLKSWYFWGFN